MEYNLGMNDNTMQEKIKEILISKVNPVLESHFGAAEFSSLEDGVVYVRMTGACASCPSAQYTVEDVVKAEIINELPEIKDVVLDVGVSDDMLDMVRKILNKEI